MATETQRFRLLGGRAPTLEEVIKDCRSLESEVAALRSMNQELLRRIQALEQK